MTIPTKPNAPVHTQMVIIWEASPTILRMVDKSDAINLRHRLYEARIRLRSDVMLFSLWHRIKDYKISITPAEGVWLVCIRDFGKAVQQAIEEAGLAAPEPPPLDE